MAINQVKYGETTLIDLTDATASSDKIVSGYSAYGRDGEKMNGILEFITYYTGSTAPSSSLGQNGDIYLDTSGGASVNNQNKSVTPTESQQTITADSGYTGLGTVTVGAISSTYVGSGITQRSSSDLTASGATVTVPAGYYSTKASKAVTTGSVTAPSSISGTSATISTNTQYNTLTLSKSVSVTPNVTTAGYISSGTAGNSSVSLTGTLSGMYQQRTITPTTSDITMVANSYNIGAQTIKGDANLVATNIKKDVSIFGVTGTYEGSSSGGPSYGTFYVTASDASSNNYISFVTYYSYSNQYFPLVVKARTSPTTEQKTFSGLIADDGYMYVSFFTSDIKYFPSVTATSGTCTHVWYNTNGAAIGSLAPVYYNVRVYKVSVGAELSIGHENYS